MAQLKLLINKTVFLASEARPNLVGDPEMVSLDCSQHRLVSAALLDGKGGYYVLGLARGLGIYKCALRIAGDCAHQLSGTASASALNNSHVPGH